MSIQFSYPCEIFNNLTSKTLALDDFINGRQLKVPCIMFLFVLIKTTQFNIYSN